MLPDVRCRGSAPLQHGRQSGVVARRRAGRVPPFASCVSRARYARHTSSCRPSQFHTDARPASTGEAPTSPIVSATPTPKAVTTLPANREELVHLPDGAWPRTERTNTEITVLANVRKRASNPPRHGRPKGVVARRRAGRVPPFASCVSRARYARHTSSCRPSQFHTQARPASTEEVDKSPTVRTPSPP